MALLPLPIGLGLYYDSWHFWLYLKGSMVDGVYALEDWGIDIIDGVYVCT